LSVLERPETNDLVVGQDTNLPHALISRRTPRADD
jgi:hypothetical protein